MQTLSVNGICHTIAGVNVALFNATYFGAMMKPEELVAEMWKAFGRWMVTRREELGWTQIFAAQQAEMERQQWQRLEKGASTKRTTVLRIADALKASREEALKMAGFGEIPEAESVVALNGHSRLKLIASKLESLPPERQEKLEPLWEMVNSELDRQLRQLKNDPASAATLKKKLPTPDAKVKRLKSGAG